MFYNDMIEKPYIAKLENSHAEEPQPFENVYNKLFSDYANYAASHSTDETSAHVADYTTELASAGILPQVSVVWGDTMAMTGHRLDWGTLNGYASGETGTAFDAVMAKGLLQQWDELKTPTFLGWFDDINRLTLDRALDVEDKTVLGMGVKSIDDILSPLKSDTTFDGIQSPAIDPLQMDADPPAGEIAKGANPQQQVDGFDAPTDQCNGVRQQNFLSNPE
jgi:hypothetical protein